MTRRLLIVGAGPMGVAAAAEAVERGLDVTILERDRVGAALARWGPVRCFTPLSMNLPERLVELVRGEVAPDAYLTGDEMRSLVLEPIVDRAGLSERLRTGVRVVAIGRKGLTRTDYPGHPLRAERPFVVQTESVAGEEAFEADLVFDATGGYTLPNPLGRGGLPARGERAAGDAIVRDHTALAQRIPQLRGRTILLAGHGHSAANAVLMLEDRGVDVIWAVRTPNRRPCEEVANDPLPERLRVVERANALATEPPAWLRVERRASVTAMAAAGGRIAVSLTGGRSLEVDAIASFTGFRPDLAHVGELQLELSPVTEGGSRLYRAISNVSDCLALPRVRPEDLETGEPGFYFIGARSYGRARTFLLQTGLEHLRTILGKIA